MAAQRDRLDVFQGRNKLGSVIMSRPGTVYAYGPQGEPVGCYADVEAAQRALAERKRAA
ncbi:hypothetical protein [Methylobacterium isbiliense]|uniref:Uncharacterized protein n=1 Tax=Methylobacterium isbiliense TaxID=315478 RepID=A0ABQ4SCD3_9HYPH|nr:hypothetical protein [Methylobacterium isbiliense]MDN3622003.1 hypothetical protein [Methylobacterium isbiliense]GJD99483.1 hypothetical protein GMJLKIPL_1401 [Methylobacterium isbiliense]